ncbi:MAG: hypothetical protein ABJB22_06015 [Verrucomicrobiota bacterium]
MRLDVYLIKSPSSFLGLVICAAATVLVAGPLQAQNPSQSQDRAQLLRTQANPSYGQGETSGEDQGYAVASPNDKDLGEQQILKRAEEYKPFMISFSAPFFYTTNVALVRSGEEDDVLFAPGISFTYQPRITKTFYGEISLGQQFFYYDRFTELNFTSFDAAAGVVYYLPQFHNLSLRARYDFNRLTDDDFDEFFSNHSFILSADLPFRIGRAQQVAVGVSTEFSFASDPDAPRRNDYSFYVGYSVNLSRSFSIDAAAKLAIRDYDVGDRTDVSEILALSAHYRIRDWLTLSFLSSFAWNQSDLNVFDYSVANVGGGIAFTVRF